MKTTSYEISKKLKDAGFRRDTQCGYMWDGDANQLCVWNNDYKIKDDLLEKDVLAYDLETIIEALPDRIKIVDRVGDEVVPRLALFKDSVAYMDCEESIISIMIMKNEALADVAAKLLLKLHEKEIIKFEKNETNPN